MEFHLDQHSGLPMYLQIVQQVKEALRLGLLDVGDQLPTVREVVAELASRKLVRVLEDWTPKYPGFCLYYPGHRHVPAALRAFAQLLQEGMSVKKAAGAAPSRGSAGARRASDRT